MFPLLHCLDAEWQRGAPPDRRDKQITNPVWSLGAGWGHSQAAGPGAWDWALLVLSQRLVPVTAPAPSSVNYPLRREDPVKQLLAFPFQGYLPTSAQPVTHMPGLILTYTEGTRNGHKTHRNEDSRPEMWDKKKWRYSSLYCDSPKSPALNDSLELTREFQPSVRSPQTLGFCLSHHFLQQTGRDCPACLVKGCPRFQDIKHEVGNDKAEPGSRDRLTQVGPLRRISLPLHTWGSTRDS